MIISGLRYFFRLQWDDFVDPLPFSSLIHPHAHRCWMKAETLPAVHQADLAQASGKGALRSYIDAGVAKFVNALNALSVGAQEAAQGSGVQDTELAEVLVNLQIVPGQFAHKASIDVVQSWTGMEEQEEFAIALLQDSHDELMARVNTTYVAEKPSDDQLNDGDDVESTGAGATAGGSIPPPSYTERSYLFGPLEHFAQSCGNNEAENILQKVRITFISDFVSEPARQEDIGEFA